MPSDRERDWLGDILEAIQLIDWTEWNSGQRQSNCLWPPIPMAREPLPNAWSPTTLPIQAPHPLVPLHRGS